MAVGNNPNSPRQKMINLMYLVFIAMMALNVSSEVLEGFVLVEDSLQNSIDNSTERNAIVSNELETYYQTNPDKVREWYNKGVQVGRASEDIYNYVQELKVRIVQLADGKKGDVNDIQHKDDLEAASRIMLAPLNGEGRQLREAIDSYRTMMANLMTDPGKQHIIEESLSTQPPRQTGINVRNWEEALFENMPVAAAITLLTKLQSDIRYAQGEVMNNLLNSVDVGDYRVNMVEAQVVPVSQIVMRGSSYEANIVLSAIDSTKRPDVYVNGRMLEAKDNGRFVVPTSNTGTFPVEGYIEMPNSDGSILRRDFRSEYFVTEPSATVAPTMMNILYAGIENPIRIAVPGIPSGNVFPSISSGSLTKKGESIWDALPAASSVGQEAIVTVTAQMADGRRVEMARTPFRVKMLPDPMPYLEYKDQNGNVRKFRGGNIVKRNLMEAGGILAAIDDDILNIQFTVLRFELIYPDSFGNMINEPTEGGNFSERQKNFIRGLARGKQFWVNRVVARGPDGIERSIPPIQVIVN
ncbi:MAG: gliding motility protein GldM [Tannerellaceae bacterium]|jgi:gliding motility-associated protein GldM|nr:gliding motility protein GldM [Tannerellaceae bacterium]